MHLKSYQIDRRLLRTGAANFSASGLKRQDNDLIANTAPLGKMLLAAMRSFLGLSPARRAPLALNMHEHTDGPAVANPFAQKDGVAAPAHT